MTKIRFKNSCSESDLNKLYKAIGTNIGARTSEEIAVAIFTESIDQSTAFNLQTAKKKYTVVVSS